MIYGDIKWMSSEMSGSMKGAMNLAFHMVTSPGPLRHVLVSLRPKLKIHPCGSLSAYKPELLERLSEAVKQTRALSDHS